MQVKILGGGRMQNLFLAIPDYSSLSTAGAGLAQNKNIKAQNQIK